MPHPVPDVPINPLRQWLIDDMTMRRFNQETQLQLDQSRLVLRAGCRRAARRTN